MDFNSLKKIRPVPPPQLGIDDKKVQSLLRDFEKIKTSKRQRKKLKRCDLLIHSIVQILRKANSDHLLYTTCIWILVSIFRLFPDEMKELMLAAGVPGVLYNILQSGMLTGSMRQYTSELCFFLSSNQPYPDIKDVPKSGPLIKLPEVSAANRYQGYLDDVSLHSDLSSEVNERKTYKKPFVPYRINEDNLNKIDSLFSHGYENELATSLPNPMLMSKFGFNFKSDDQNSILSDSDQSKDEEDEDASINSTLSSGTQSLTLQSLQSSSNSVSLSNSRSRSMLATIQNNSVNNFKSNYNSFPIQVTSENISSELNTKNRYFEWESNMNNLSFKSSNSQQNDFKSLAERVMPTTSHYRPKTIATERAKSSHFHLGSPLSSPPPRTSSSSYNNNNHIHNPIFKLDTISHLSLQSPQSKIINFPTKDFHDESSQLSQPSIISRDKDNYVEQSVPIKESTSYMTNSNFISGERNPRFIDLVHSRRLKHPHPSTAPMARPGIANRQYGNMNGTISDLISQLDPLSVNIGIGLTFIRSSKRNKSLRITKILDDGDDGTWVSDDDEDENFDDYDDDDSSIADNNGDDDETGETDIGIFDSNIVEDGHSKSMNYFLQRKKMRIRAEKLLDHKFTKKLFNKKATTSQMQNMIYRMESILQLMDPNGTGFVTWECFARLILAVAPSHLLRADVIAFMNAQTDSNENLIDYKEFIISGKVTIIDKHQTKTDNLPVTGWLKRQKLYSGEESTYTWKNHVKWYQSRKAKAVVWLMRRATRSLRHAIRIEQSREFLLKQSKRALAATYLLEVGYIAIHLQDKWIDAKRKLLRRMIHARKWSQIVDSSQMWLVSTAKGVLFQMEMEDELNNSLDTNSVSTLDTLVQPKKKQADYATFYKVYQYYALAVSYLKKRGESAINHCYKQDEIQLCLQKYAQKSLMHQMYVEIARNWLVCAGDRAYKFCMQRDDVMKYLYRKGQFALSYLVRQDNAVPWLQNRGNAALKFISLKHQAVSFLINKGINTLRYLNNREYAFASLVARRRRAEIILQKKKESIIFLTKQPLGVWEHEDFRQNTQLTLEEIGRKAMNHVYRKQLTFTSLKYTADKATIALRRRTMAFADLLEFAQEAKITRFEMHCKISSLYSKRVIEESRRLISADAKKYSSRQTMHKELRWKTELSEAFDFISKAITPSIYHNGKESVIGRIGFNKLLMDGKLLGLTKELTFDLFKFVDPGSTFFVRFDNVWFWFLNRANAYENSLPNKKQLKFTAADILSPYYRALVLQLKRVNSENIELQSDFDWDSLAEARRRAAEDASSSDEEEMEEDIDEDLLFSDLNYLKNADIGRLMRYLTKKRQLKEGLMKLDSNVLSNISSETIENKDQNLLISNSENENTNNKETLIIVKEESTVDQIAEKTT